MSRHDPHLRKPFVFVPLVAGQVVVRKASQFLPIESQSRRRLSTSSAATAPGCTFRQILPT